MSRPTTNRHIPCAEPRPRVADRTSVVPRGQTRGAGAVAVAALAGLAACSSDDAPSAALAGVYHGMMALEADDPERSIFATVELQVDGDGELSIGRATTTSPTRIVGERGELTGQIRARDQLAADATIELQFPTLGGYAASGTLIYAELTQSLAGRLTTRDDAFAVVGTTLWTIMR